jgi:hypothetical protein
MGAFDGRWNSFARRELATSVEFVTLPGGATLDPSCRELVKQRL